MKTAIDKKKYSVEEYIQYELTANERHEFINGQLFAMPGEKDTNNQIAFLLAMLLYKLLDKEDYQIYTHDIKVGIPSEEKYYYPDLFITKEPKQDNNRYIKYEPELIVEVVSDSTQTNDYVDKYISYTKISSLKYYLIIEPEVTLINVFEKVGNDWIVHKYTQKEEAVKLEQLGVSFVVGDVYGI